MGWTIIKVNWKKNETEDYRILKSSSVFQQVLKLTYFQTELKTDLLGDHYIN